MGYEENFRRNTENKYLEIFPVEYIEEHIMEYIEIKFDVIHERYRSGISLHTLGGFGRTIVVLKLLILSSLNKC